MWRAFNVWRWITLFSALPPLSSSTCWRTQAVSLMPSSLCPTPSGRCSSLPYPSQKRALYWLPFGMTPTLFQNSLYALCVLGITTLCRLFLLGWPPSAPLLVSPLLPQPCPLRRAQRELSLPASEDSWVVMETEVAEAPSLGSCPPRGAPHPSVFSWEQQWSSFFNAKNLMVH